MVPLSKMPELLKKLVEIDNLIKNGKIKTIKGRQVFDSRGIQQLKLKFILTKDNASAIVPSGASTGTHEAFELRDTDNKSYLGKSVTKAVENIKVQLAKSLKILT